MFFYLPCQQKPLKSQNFIKFIMNPRWFSSFPQKLKLRLTLCLKNKIPMCCFPIDVSPPLEFKNFSRVSNIYLIKNVPQTLSETSRSQVIYVFTSNLLGLDASRKKHVSSSCCSHSRVFFIRVSTSHLAKVVNIPQSYLLLSLVLFLVAKFGSLTLQFSQDCLMF